MLNNKYHSTLQSDSRCLALKSAALGWPNKKASQSNFLDKFSLNMFLFFILRLIGLLRCKFCFVGLIPLTRFVFVFLLEMLTIFFLYLISINRDVMKGENN